MNKYIFCKSIVLLSLLLTSSADVGDMMLTVANPTSAASALPSVEKKLMRPMGLQALLRDSNETKDSFVQTATNLPDGSRLHQVWTSAMQTGQLINKPSELEESPYVIVTPVHTHAAGIDILLAKYSDGIYSGLWSTPDIVGKSGQETAMNVVRKEFGSLYGYAGAKNAKDALIHIGVTPEGWSHYLYLMPYISEKSLENDLQPASKRLMRSYKWHSFDTLLDDSGQSTLHPFYRHCIVQQKSALSELKDFNMVSLQAPQANQSIMLPDMNVSEGLPATGSGVIFISRDPSGELVMLLGNEKGKVGDFGGTLFAGKDARVSAGQRAVAADGSGVVFSSDKINSKNAEELKQLIEQSVLVRALALQPIMYDHQYYTYAHYVNYKPVADIIKDGLIARDKLSNFRASMSELFTTKLTNDGGQPDWISVQFLLETLKNVRSGKLSSLPPPYKYKFSGKDIGVAEIKSSAGQALIHFLESLILKNNLQ